MARVPVYNTPQVAPNSLPARGFSAPAMPPVAGQQAQEMGMAMQNFGGHVGYIAQDMAVQANRARIADGMNQLVKAGTDLTVEAGQLTGRNALERPGGKSLADEYGAKLKEVSDSITTNLGNDVQRDAFKQQAAQFQLDFYRSMTSHMVKQQSVFQAETRKATLETAVDRAARLGADEGSFNQALGAIRATVYEQAAATGSGEEAAQNEYRKLADQTYQARYKAWQQSDPLGALANYQARQSDISPLVRDRIATDLFQSAAPLLADKAKPWLLSTGSAPVGNPALAGEPRGVRNNNPGNIQRSDEPWQGEVPGNDPRYASFATPEAGIRAMGKNLLTYQDKYGLNSVEAIVSRWAPATENDTPGYAASVAKALGVKTDAPIDLHDANTLGKVVRSMIQVENGKQPYSNAQIDAGVGAALGTTALPSSTDKGEIAAPYWRSPDAVTGVSVLDGLPPDQRLRVFQLAQAQVHQDMAQLRESLHARVQDSTAEYLARGTASNPPSEAEFIRAYGQTDGVKRYRELRDAADLGVELQRVKFASDADLAKMLTEARPSAGEGFASRARNYEILERAVKSTMETRQKDPILYALQDPARGFSPLTNFGNAQTMAQELGKRHAAMYSIASSFGTRPAIMADQEAESFGLYLGSLQAPDKARALGDVFKAAGADGVQSLATQLKDSSLAVAAMLTPYQSKKGDNAALLYLQGKDALEQKRAKIDQTAETGAKAEIYKAINDVYQTPQGRDAAAEAAYGIFAKLKADGNDNVDRAVDLATGGIMQFNGAKIAKPYGWSDNQFRDAMRHRVPDAIKATGADFNIGGQKVGAAELAAALPGARLQTYGQGTYLIMSGNDVVRTAENRPFILKVDP
ncbi:hypothetical protein [Magnetospirillum aberrantis]|uniref:Uncharacterized protein n=1 Tax=Magnetospirillum aberrantis SpK TaxID=908842 RepID=A0A7C9QWW1_9PROT|nr:hypothetical protein [Magnetospirillum aberrantis]NFV82119.1 hypothetical protein [Magnetospirillum aberrantis SpK]